MKKTHQFFHKDYNLYKKKDVKNEKIEGDKVITH